MSLYLDKHWREEFIATANAGSDMIPGIEDAIDILKMAFEDKERLFKARDEIKSVLEIQEFEALAEARVLGKQGPLNGSTVKVREKQALVLLHNLPPEHPYSRAVKRHNELDNEYRQAGVDVDIAQATLSAKNAVLRFLGYKLRALGG